MMKSCEDADGEVFAAGSDVRLKVSLVFYALKKIKKNSVLQYIMVSTLIGHSPNFPDNSWGLRTCWEYCEIEIVIRFAD